MAFPPNARHCPSSRERDHTIAFYAFDLLLMAGEDIKGLPRETRRKMLRTKLLPQLVEPIRMSESFDVPADQLIRVIRESGLEGVIAKRHDSLNEPGRRSGASRKMRVNRAFIGANSGSPSGVRSQTFFEPVKKDFQYRSHRLRRPLR